VIGADDFLEVGFGQLAVDAVNERAHFPRVNEQGFTFAIAEFGFGTRGVRPSDSRPAGFVLGEEPEAHGNLRAVKQLAGQRHHAVHQVGLDDGFADVSFAGLIG